MPQPNVDFGGSSNFVSHAKKKKKQTPNWDEPAEENGNEGRGGQEGDTNGGGAAGGDGGGGGGGADGAGDNNGDGGAGDDALGDEWNAPGGKKKKKSKKVLAEEERRKREEEEEAAEKKRKEEEEADAADANPPGTFSWADDTFAGANDNANAIVDNEFGFTTKKRGKMDKKPKVSTSSPEAIAITNDLSIRMITKTLWRLAQSQPTSSMILTFQMT